MALSDHGQADQLDDILASYLKAAQNGQAPAEHELLQRHPELRPQLQAFFKDQALFEGLTAPLRTVLAAADEPIGTTLGDYELLEELAHGGMGVVWKARQKSLNRVVALKLLRAGPLASAADRRRFRSEAESVARLDHPHIVPIYEVGEAGDQLYFSMKLLDGGSLVRHLGRFRQEPRAAAQLLKTVAAAVHYAHQRGILHRDLKPANILLDGRDEPHVSDFGLAKRLEDVGDPAALTQTGAILGTPSYMAPEQAFGRRSAITTAADVYGLGAILYEILAGRPPFKEATVAETVRRLLDTEPPAPRTLNSKADRDLETICLKCLEKDPTARYASAQELADDLERYLIGEPILARPVSPAQRLSRWCRRHPLPLALVTSLLVGFVLVSWQWLRADGHARTAAANLVQVREERDRADEARKTAETAQGLAEQEKQRALKLQKQSDEDRARLEARYQQLQQAVGDFLKHLKQAESRSPASMVPGGKELLETARHYYENLLQERPNDNALRMELADTYARLGRLSGDTGARAEAVAYFKEALKHYQRLHEADGTHVGIQVQLAETWHNLAVNQPDEDGPEARRGMEQARTLYEKFLAASPDSVFLLRGLAANLTAEALRHHRAKQSAEALALLQQARKHQEKAVQLSHDEGFARNGLARILNETGHVQGAQKEQLPQALASFRQAAAIREDLVRQHPQIVDFQRGLASTYHNISAVQHQLGQQLEALASLQKARAGYERLAQSHPNAAAFRERLAAVLGDIGQDYFTAGQLTEAMNCYQQVRAIREQLIEDKLATPGDRKELALTHHAIADIYSKQKKPLERVAALQQGRQLLAALVKEQPDQLEFRRLLAVHLNHLAIVVGQNRQLDESLACARQAVEHAQFVFDKSATDLHRSTIFNCYGTLGEVWRVREQWGEAVAATLVRKKFYPDSPRELFRVARDLAWISTLMKPQTPEEEEQRRKYADLALAALREAADRGWKEPDVLLKDNVFGPLRTRADFQELLRELQK